MELEAGFKLSEAGPIPEDWEAAPIGERYRFVRTYPVARSGLAAHGAVRCIHYGDIHVRFDATLDVARQFLPGLRGRETGGLALLQSHDVVMADAAEDLEGVGKAVELLNVGRTAVVGGLHTFALTPVAEPLAPGFAARVFQSVAYRTAVERLASGLKVFGISKTALASVSRPMPPRAEQSAVAEVSNDIDAWIAAAQAEAAKLASVKAAAMDALLTPTTRLPGFSENWSRVRLGDCGTFRKGRGITRAEVRGAGLPAIRYGELYTRFDGHIREFDSYISADSAEGALGLQFGDICFAASGETAEEIGKSAALLYDGPCFAGSDIIVLSPDREDPTFLGYLLNTPVVTEQKARLGQGDAVVHIHADKLAELEVDLPDVKEQQAIAAVLSDIDAALAAARAVVAKARGVKAAAMDALLSGCVRLPPFGPAARVPADALEAA